LESLYDYSAEALAFCDSIESEKEGIKGLIIFFEQPLKKLLTFSVIQVQKF
jgi:hypothetical protein